MKSVLLGSVAAVAVAIVAILVFEYGGVSTAEQFSIDGTTRLD